jgi:hypothetical protein
MRRRWQRLCLGFLGTMACTGCATQAMHDTLREMQAQQRIQTQVLQILSTDTTILRARASATHGVPQPARVVSEEGK